MLEVTSVHPAVGKGDSQIGQFYTAESRDIQMVHNRTSALDRRMVGCTAAAAG
jgi:hypothetical protein